MFGIFKKKAEDSILSINPALGMLRDEPTASPCLRKVFQGDPEAVMKDRMFLLGYINEHPTYKDVSEEIKQQAIDQETMDWLETQATSKVEIKKYPKEERKQNLYSILRKLTALGLLKPPSF